MKSTAATEERIKREEHAFAQRIGALDGRPQTAVEALAAALSARTAPLRRNLAAALDRIGVLERRLAALERRAVMKPPKPPRLVAGGDK